MEHLEKLCYLVYLLREKSLVADSAIKTKKKPWQILRIVSTSMYRSSCCS